MLTLNLNILWTVVNILVLFVLLRKFLYRPVMNVIEQRQKQIDDAIADAEGKKNDAQAVCAPPHYWRARNEQPDAKKQSPPRETGLPGGDH